MPYVVLTNDAGDVFYSRYVTEETLRETTNFLKRRLPIIREIQEFKRQYDAIKALLEPGQGGQRGATNRRNKNVG